MRTATGLRCVPCVAAGYQPCARNMAEDRGRVRRANAGSLYERPPRDHWMLRASCHAGGDYDGQPGHGATPVTSGYASARRHREHRSRRHQYGLRWINAGPNNKVADAEMARRLPFALCALPRLTCLDADFTGDDLDCTPQQTHVFREFTLTVCAARDAGQLRSLRYIGHGYLTCDASACRHDGVRTLPPESCLCAVLLRGMPLENLISYLDSHGLCADKAEIMRALVLRGEPLGKPVLSPRARVCGCWCPSECGAHGMQGLLHLLHSSPHSPHSPHSLLTTLTKPTRSKCSRSRWPNPPDADQGKAAPRLRRLCQRPQNLPTRANLL